MSTATSATNGATEPPATDERAVALLTHLIERVEFARLHGLSYGGERDLYKVGGYPTTLRYEQFAGMYERDGVAARVVDVPVRTTWRNPPLVTVEGEEADTGFAAEFAALAKRLGLWARLERVDRLARLGRYAVLLIGVRGTDDQGLSTPLLPVPGGADDVLYLSAFSERYAKIDTWVNDPADPRFGLPETYRIDLSGGVANFRGRAPSGSVVVHWSRVIHVAEDRTEDDVFGREALRRVYNDLMDFQKVATSTAEGFWQRVAGILQAVIDKDTRISEADLQALDEHLRELYHDLRRTFYGQGVELRRLAESEPNPGPAADLYMTRVAAGSGMPKRILFGSETGERASSEDMKHWLGQIAERQAQHAEPDILRPLIDRLIEARALARPSGDEYTVVWPPLFEEPEKDIAEANKTRAEAAKALTPVGGDPLTLVEIDEERNVWLRPTGERGELTPEELEPPEPEPVPDPDALPTAEDEGDEPTAEAA